ncbi:hypothetical protein ABID22_002596 [Pontibacter aydingkolensis]|uniref:Lipoprotein n=1 Tax=Pontibacter aydingkolensis TaxID=1911536 RepID=A0ABS7CWG3_9BACT|nr:hypothetical protein [Pontibacter aydingkolensis]MBW7468194.1 hypothetical protein [Pontibacter aydingkolensis]
MLNHLYPLLLVFLLWQCSNYETNDPIEEVKIGEDFMLTAGEQVKIVGEGEPLVLQFSSVTDSRCPENAICMWLGNATVMLNASNTAEKNKQIQMCIGDCSPLPVQSKHKLDLEVGGAFYTITLKEATPLPGGDKAGESKHIRLVVNHQ